MANFLTIRGFACSGIELRNTQTGLVVGNFRMGSTHRRQDPVTNAWVDGDTNWFRVNVFRALARNASSSVHKGDRIIVVGRLHLVNYIRKDGNPGISVEIDAESIGPDLQFGTALYVKTAAQRPADGQTASNGAGAPETEGGAGSGDTGQWRAPFASDRLDDDPGRDADAEGDGGGRDADDHADAYSEDGDGAMGEADVKDGEAVNLETGELVGEKAPF